VERERVACVGAIVVDGDRLLLVKRGTEPSKGSWSVPGGRVEPGESDVAAVAREVHEETGLAVRVGPLAGSVERDGLGGALYVIRDYRCEPLSPTARVRAGDDAADVGWFTAAEVRRLPCTPGLVETLEEWHVLPG
jgi:ADP-ribose pyrophosphatase YjhB (NUDIX family)